MLSCFRLDQSDGSPESHIASVAKNKRLLDRVISCDASAQKTSKFSIKLNLWGYFEMLALTIWLFLHLWATNRVKFPTFGRDVGIYHIVNLCLWCAGTTEYGTMNQHGAYARHASAGARELYMGRRFLSRLTN